jgi:biopolymer transport protein ExbD
VTEEQNIESTDTGDAGQSVDGAYAGWADQQPPMKRKKMLKDSGTGEVPMPNITSLLDALFIILVFLLKSYSTNPVSVTLSSDLKLVSSAARLSPKDAVPVIVDKAGITVDGVQAMKFDKGEIPADQVAGHIIAPLSEALRDQAEKQRKLSQLNTDVSFKGELILICDKDLSYKILRDVLMTAGDAEYGNFRFAVIKAAG